MWMIPHVIFALAFILTARTGDDGLATI